MGTKSRVSNLAAAADQLIVDSHCRCPLAVAALGSMPDREQTDDICCCLIRMEHQALGVDRLIIRCCLLERCRIAIIQTTECISISSAK